MGLSEIWCRWTPLIAMNLLAYQMSVHISICAPFRACHECPVIRTTSWMPSHFAAFRRAFPCPFDCVASYTKCFSIPFIIVFNFTEMLSSLGLKCATKLCNFIDFLLCRYARQLRIRIQFKLSVMPEECNVHCMHIAHCNTHTNEPT